MNEPFIKWAGGKRRVLNSIMELFPESFNDYHEPFIGGGALLFALDGDRKRFIGDSNDELINAYTVVRDDVDALVEHLKTHENEKDYFYAQRLLDRKPGLESLSKVERASRFIFLNKTAFNGLYRVNNSGYFNVSFGSYKNPAIVNEGRLRECSKHLQGVNISDGDFSESLKSIKAGDLVYIDPPYMPVSKTSNFTGYTKGGFTDEMQQRVKDFCDALTAKGAYFIQSNSAAEGVFTLYHDYEVKVIQASRRINSKASGRGKVDEVLISNINLVSKKKGSGIVLL